MFPTTTCKIGPYRPKRILTAPSNPHAHNPTNAQNATRIQKHLKIRKRLPMQKFLSQPSPSLEQLPIPLLLPFLPLAIPL